MSEYREVGDAGRNGYLAVAVRAGVEGLAGEAMPMSSHRTPGQAMATQAFRREMSRVFRDELRNPTKERPTMSDVKQPTRAPGEVSTERVQRALAMAAGDILQRSKLSPEARMRVAADVSKLAADYEALAKTAWEA